MILGIFVYLFIYEVTTTKVNLINNFKKQYSQVATGLLCKMLVSLFSSNIPLCIGKKSRGKNMQGFPNGT